MGVCKGDTDTYDRLRITVLAAHGQIQPEGITIDDVNVASFRSSQSVDSSTEGLVSVDVNHNPRIFTVDRHYN